jgi:mannose-6-phosphate isomerase-like protein (cupin superfamily)
VNEVIETISGVPIDQSRRIVRRDEGQLFELPKPEVLRFLKRDLPPLAVYRFPAEYEPVTFAPPRGVFEGPTLRLEWQTMAIEGRQPFYHRNADVDEIGYQVAGERTLITECGTVRFKVGQFARIPVGVAHDNHGRGDIHLIFYLHGPAATGVEPVAYAEHLAVPYAGWEASSVVETITDGLGGPNGDLSYSMADERLLLAAGENCPDPLEILEATAPAGLTEWLYRAPRVWIGHTLLEPVAGRRYDRRIYADEIQYQVEGTRTIVSQRGVVTLEPGEFTCIPRGCAFANVAHGRSKHLSVLTLDPVPPVPEINRTADMDIHGWLVGNPVPNLEGAL